MAVRDARLWRVDMIGRMTGLGLASLLWMLSFAGPVAFAEDAAATDEAKPAAEAAKPEEKKAEAGKPQAAPDSDASIKPLAPAAQNPSDEVRILFRDSINFIKLGRFKIAGNFIEALLAKSPDPLQLQELAENTYPDSIETLITASAVPEASASAVKLLDAIKEGQFKARTDPKRITREIERLGDSSRSFDLALKQLAVSGEYAVPYMVDYLSRPEYKNLHALIVRALPQMGLPVVAPLCQTLNMNDMVVKQLIIGALADIGYPQALPYLKQLADDSKQSADVRTEANKAIEKITRGQNTGASAADLFQTLAENYYYDKGSLRADRQYKTANVWYWDPAIDPPHLKRIEVPVEIYNDVMAMRCSESALRLDPNKVDAIALWLAANFNRENDLAGGTDASKPENYQPAAYWARAAGPSYNYLVLSRGLRDANTPVSLGAIRALQSTDGALVNGQQQKAPLIQALNFHDRAVRIEAALAIAQSLPVTQFAGHQNVVPVLAEGALLSNKQSAVVIIPDENLRNQVRAWLEGDGFNVVAEGDPIAALNLARAKLPGVDAIFIASETGGGSGGEGLRKALGQIQEDLFFSGAVVVILANKDQTVMASKEADLAKNRISVDFSGQQKQDLTTGLAEGIKKSGRKPLDTDQAQAYALQCVDALKLLAITQNRVLPFTVARNALLGALNRNDFEELQIKAAEVLALDPSDAAQQAIATLALSGQGSPTLRSAAFNSLAESAKRIGNKLTAEQVQTLVDAVPKITEADVRVAASRALGALDVRADIAGTLIRNQSKDNGEK